MNVTLPKVRNREVNIGEPWEVLVRIRNLDMSATDWDAQIRQYPEAEDTLATPTITAEFVTPDTLVHITLTADQTADLEPGRAVWGLKAERSLFWGDLLLKDRPPE